MRLLNIFTGFYETLIGTENTGLDYQNAFQGVGTITIFISIAMAIIFYLLLGRWRPIWAKKSHWWITLILTMLINFALALLMSESGVDGYSFGGYVIKFGLLNALLGGVYFFLASLITKRWSIFSGPVPF